MCNFFSLVSNGDGKPLYFNWEQRQKILKGEIKQQSADSHTSIADYYGFVGAKEDTLNKYEYNPITKVFQIDQKNNPIDDSKDIEDFCRKVDFKTIIEPLNLHPMIHPFKDFKATKVSKKDLELLKQWASVWVSVRDSVGDSVGVSVRDSVGDSVGDSVWVSVWDSVGDSVWASVGASVGAYVGSYFDVKYKVDITPSNKLWNKGIVPSFDGKLWRLHGHEGKVIWRGKMKDIK
jgi:hypothetical protein